MTYKKTIMPAEYYLITYIWIRAKETELHYANTVIRGNFCDWLKDVNYEGSPEEYILVNALPISETDYDKLRNLF